RDHLDRIVDLSCHCASKRCQGKKCDSKSVARQPAQRHHLSTLSLIVAGGWPPPTAATKKTRVPQGTRRFEHMRIATRSQCLHLPLNDWAILCPSASMALSRGQKAASHGSQSGDFRNDEGDCPNRCRKARAKASGAS